MSPVAPYVTGGVHRMIDASAIRSHLKDSYAPRAYVWEGWPIASDDMRLSAWPVHCYAHVGVARDTETTGTGSELAVGGIVGGDAGVRGPACGGCGQVDRLIT